MSSTCEDVKISKADIKELREFVNTEFKAEENGMNMNSDSLITHAIWIVQQTEDYPVLKELWDETFGLEAEALSIHEEQMRNYDREIGKSLGLR